MTCQHIHHPHCQLKHGGLVQAAAVVTAPASLGGAILGSFEGKAGWVCLRSVSNKQLVHFSAFTTSVQVAG